MITQYMYVELPYMNAISAEIMVSSFTYCVKTILLNLCRSFYHCLAFTPNVNDFLLQKKLSAIAIYEQQKHWGCKRMTGVAKFHIGDATATSKEYKVLPLVKRMQER